jgi:hypothetical protein
MLSLLSEALRGVTEDLIRQPMATIVHKSRLGVRHAVARPVSHLFKPIHTRSYPSNPRQ